MDKPEVCRLSSDTHTASKAKDDKHKWDSCGRCILNKYLLQDLVPAGCLVLYKIKGDSTTAIQFNTRGLAFWKMPMA